MRPNKTAAVAVVLSGIALAGATWATIEPITVRQDAAVAQQDAAAGRSLADRVAEACAKGGAAAAELGPAGTCAKAAEVQGLPTAVAAPAVDPEALRTAARTAVAEYCSTRNGCRGADGSTPDFNAIVTAVVARIPAPQNGTNGQPGQDASADQIATAVATYCGQADEPCRGLTGATGAPGQPGAAGAQGAQGPQGVSVTDVKPVRDDAGNCQWVVTLHDPATGADSTVTHPASDSACPSKPILPPN